MPTLECRFCKKQFKATRGTCCRSCRPLADRERSAAYRKKNPNAYREWYKRTHQPKPKRVLGCVACRTDFYPRGRQLRCDKCIYELSLARGRAFKRANRSKMRDYDRRWSRENSDKKKANVRRVRYRRNWLKALRRDCWQCTLCGSTKMLVVHHKDNRGRNHPSPNHSLDNLQTLCRACHINHHRKDLRRAS